MITLILSLLRRKSRRFSWAPAVDTADRRFLSTLLPGAQY